jgi:Uma2 family endonuclease
MSAAILPTTPPTTTSTPPPVPAGPRPIKWTCDDLYKMENLPSVQNQKIMLIDGEILVMAAPSVLASISQQLAENYLRAIFPPDQYSIRGQLGMFFGINTDPVPDVAVVAGPPRAHAHHPRTALLIVEIADTSLAMDTGDKASLYAAAGIQDYWVIDVNDRRLHLFRDSQPDPAAKYGASYKQVQALGHTDTVSPLAAAVHAIPVADLLP